LPEIRFPHRHALASLQEGKMSAPNQVATSTEVRTETGDWLQWMPGEWLSIRLSSADTDGRYTVVEVLAEPRSGPPLHIHVNEDEHFIVLDGTIRFVCGDRTFDGSAGTVVTVPKGVTHAWANVSDADARMLVTFAPGGIEHCFEAFVGAAPEQITAIAAAHACTIVGPPIGG
jgi:mannose-6-phosphate isomerase-like protein (cupin superfamily)